MKPTIEYADFDKLELRVGEVIAASAPEWSQKLLSFTVDFGPEIGQKQIMSGVKAWYQPEDFMNKKFLFVVNLAERKMGEGISQGMMIMADSEERPTIFPLPSDLPSGSIVR
jgi:methionyl-tRNA synthetase